MTPPRFDDDVARLLGLLSEATARIEQPYFALPIAGQRSPAYRERVYAYELYHRLRERWPEDWPFLLNGEVDKAAHPLAAMQAAGVRDTIPDFLVHGPGDMRRNLAIVEIKNARSRLATLTDDLAKLWAFCGRPRYKQGILLLFGPAPARDRVVERCQEFLDRKCPEAHRAKVAVWWHRRIGEAAEAVV